MISVESAAEMVVETARSFGSEAVDIEQTYGRVLAEDIVADRDLPPFDRSMMDGIAIRADDLAGGVSEFKVVAVQAAGDTPVDQLAGSSCVQIMTGAAVPASADIVIPIEQVVIEQGLAKVDAAAAVTRGQFIHSQGADATAGNILVKAGTSLSATTVPIAASVGKQQVLVAQPPRICIVSTGDELVDIASQPAPEQIRRSNDQAIKAALHPYGAQSIHIKDDLASLRSELTKLIDSYDCIILSGGVSKGEFDYIPQVLAELSVDEIFHGVAQKPGGPFWFGRSSSGVTVFALPGNPVSTLACTYRYVLPWLKRCLGQVPRPQRYAVLSQPVPAVAGKTQFLQVKLQTDSASGRVLAEPIEHNGSGDFRSLVEADGFIELPASSSSHHQPGVYRLLAFGGTM